MCVVQCARREERIKCKFMDYACIFNFTVVGIINWLFIELLFRKVLCVFGR